MDVQAGGKLLRRMNQGLRPPQHPAHRTGRGAGIAMAGINADTYRHFGRLGGGAAMGAKNVKAMVIMGDGSFPTPEDRGYRQAFCRSAPTIDPTEDDAEVPQPGHTRSTWRS